MTPHATPRPTLVLIHGLFSSPREFDLLSRILRARRIAFECLEIPGYTSPAATRGSTWRDWVDAADAALDARYAAGAPIVLSGLCAGGMIAAALALRPRHQSVTGLALMAPTFACDGWSIGHWQRWRRLAYLLHIDRWIEVREREPFGIKNLKTRQWVARELAERKASAIGPAALSLRGIRETERLCAFVAARFAGIAVPVLALHAREDEIASIASVERVLDRATVATRLVVLERSFHMITIDNDRQIVAHALADFVDARSSAPPGSRRRAAHLDPVGRPRPVRSACLFLHRLWMPT